MTILIQASFAPYPPIADRNVYARWFIGCYYEKTACDM